MKIKIKKIYIVGFLSFTCLLSGYLISQDFLRELSQKGLTTLIVPAVFIFSVLYVYGYFRDYNLKIKIAEEVAKEVSEGNLEKEEKIKTHLIKKINNEKNIIL